MKSILYRRASTAKQEIGMDVQDRAQVLYCERLGVEVLRVFADADTSGSIKMRDREGGGQMLAFIESLPKPDLEGLILVTHKQDRMGRDTIDQIETIRKVWGLGIVPHFTEEGGPLPRTNSNELTFEIKASVAQYERNVIRQRIRDAAARALDTSERWGQESFGWVKKATGQFRTRSNGTRHEVFTLVPQPEEQAWLKRIIEWRLRGDGGNAGPWGYGRIAKALNEAGVKSKRAGENLGGERPASGKWDKSVVRQLLIKNKHVTKLINELNLNPHECRPQ